MKNLLICLTIFIMGSIGLSAHNKTIKGTVKTPANEPITGASIRIEGTVLGSKSDKDGHFIIKRIPDGSYILKISAIGYETMKGDITFEHHDGDEFLMDFVMVENPVQTSSVVVTANRSENIYGEVPVKVSTISEKELQISSSSNIREGLQYQPGVRTEVNCQNCGYSQVRINGLDGKYSQILIDGKAVFSSLNGVYGLEQIPSNMIERVEVVRGGGSSLYGGNAIAGVINIITKEPCYNSFNINWSNFSVNTSIPENVLNLNSSFINDEQNVGLNLFGMLNKRHEYDANNDGFSEIGRMDVSTFGGKLFWKPSPKSKISAEFHNINHQIRGGNNLDLEPHQADVTEFAENSTFLGQINYETYFVNSNKFNAYLSAQATKRHSYYGANQDLNAYGTTDNHTIAGGINYNIVHDLLFGEHILILGIDYNNDFMLDKAPAYNRVIDQNVKAAGFYFQDDWMLAEGINMLIGLRSEKHNLINDLIYNPRVSLLGKLSDKLSLRLTYSTGYRAPQAFDEDLHITQVNGEGFVIKLDNGLKPEYSHSISSSLDYSFRIFDMPFAVCLEYFNTRLNDVFVMVDEGSDINGNRTLMRKNGESAKVEGLTFELQTTGNDYLIKTGITYQSAKFNQPVEWSAGIPDNNIAPKYSDKIFKTPDLYGFILASFNITDNLVFESAAYYTGEMYLPHYAGYIESDRLVNTESFIDLNVKLVYNLSKTPNLKIGLGLQNILNNYQKDFDMGVNRDAGYMYGPFRPFSTMLNIGINL